MAETADMLNICPILNINSEGKLIPRDKCRGKKKAIRQLMEQMKLHAENGTDYAGTCYILHSSCEEDAKELSELIRQTFPHVKQPVSIFSIGTVIGSHTGPGTVAAIFWGDERGA